MAGGTGLEFRLLGPFEVYRAGEPVAVRPPRERALLAALLLRANKVVPLDRLIGLLWDDAPPATARNTVHTLVWRLRRRFADVLVSRPPGYVIGVQPDQLDVNRFARLVDRGREALNRGEDAVPLFDDALALWRGTPLCDVPGEELRRSVLPLGELRLAAVEGRVEALLRLGRHTELVVELRGLVADHPLREPLTGQLMLALYRSGRQADALAAFRALRERLADELGVEPGPAAQRLHRAILAAEPSLDRIARDRAAYDPAAPDPPSASGPGGRPAPRVVPAQLPADIAAFAGRAAQLAELDRCLDPTGHAAPAVVISAIDGTPGIGKTALALHWAHRVAHRFAGGQLYLNLRGYDPVRPPVKPAEAIRGFLDALDVPPHRVPSSVDAQAALYRSLLAGKRVLVVLDNARDAGQVRPLLPGAPGCLVLVTSRSQLAGLVAAEAARPLTLGVLSTVEARELLAGRLGEARVAAEPEAVHAIVRACAGLPLALAVVAARAAVQPRLSLGRLADTRLDALDGADPTTDVRAVFSWSYRTLSRDTAYTFRVLGLHGGTDIGVTAAASLAGGPVDRSLAELTRAHLVTEPVPGRYAIHDLLRAYAAERAHAEDSEDERRAAVRRLLDHYLHTAHAAAGLLYPHRETIPLDDPAPAPLADHRQALEWLTTEHGNLLAAIDTAAREGFDEQAWKLAWTLWTYLDLRGHWHDLARTQTVALAAARRLGNRTAQAYAHRYLARARVQTGDFAAAHRDLARALRLYERLADPTGQGHVHHNLAVLYGLEGRHREALGHAGTALDRYRMSGGLPAMQAQALNQLGACHSRLGDHERALAYCREAVAMMRDLGNRHGQAGVWVNIGLAQRGIGDLEAAEASYRRALGLFRDLGDRPGEADALTQLGEVRAAAGDPAGAMRAWRRAAAILDDLGHPNADRVRALLVRPGPAWNTAAAVATTALHDPSD